jgi:hypothetical protein
MDPAPRGWRRPRIHDLRHTFACRTLEAHQKEQDDIDRHIVALSAYMGHTNISDTYWYLESRPQLMQNIAKNSTSVRKLKRISFGLFEQFCLAIYSRNSMYTLFVQDKTVIFAILD